MKSNTLKIVLSLTALFVFGGVCSVGLSEQRERYNKLSEERRATRR